MSRRDSWVSDKEGEANGMRRQETGGGGRRRETIGETESGLTKG
jgi:hypothetical protein